MNKEMWEASMKGRRYFEDAMLGRIDRTNNALYSIVGVLRVIAGAMIAAGAALVAMAVG